ncbi:MAG: penicillin-binding protein 2 [Devosiaceae bacterium]|nr:penicillin-binding protein 2 [Devosiaceae bacterium MH13]
MSMAPVSDDVRPTGNGPGILLQRARAMLGAPSDVPNADEADGSIHLDGTGKTLAHETRGRMLMFVAILCLVYAVIGGRLLELGLRSPDAPVLAATPQQQIRASRPDITDRHGVLLATDVPATAVYADPSILVDVDDAVDRLVDAMPDASRDTFRARLSRQSQFEWIARDLTPSQRDALMRQGIPGVGFLEESRRFYPSGRLAAHVLGAVNVDHEGLEGIERYLDREPLANLAQFGFLEGGEADFAPTAIALDARVQHVMRDVLERGLERYQAIGATAALMDVRTGEVLGLVSLPDFDPNTREGLGDEDALNRAVGGVYELGSVFKVFTIAAGLDSGAVAIDTMHEARRPIRIGNSTINDFHARRAMLSTTEVFTSSSNIGTIRIAEAMGIPVQRAYYERLGLLSRMDVELPGAARPFYPDGEWSRLSAATISFGHGLTTTPLQLLTGVSATVNGGILINPTFLPRGETDAMQAASRVLSEQTSAYMREMFRANVLDGSGRRAAVEGLDVGGKTGTAEKIVDGAYSGDHRLNSFVSAFPMHEPQYAMIVVIDEPQPAEGQRSATAGLNAAPMSGEIISRVAPLLGLVPQAPAAN